MANDYVHADYQAALDALKSGYVAGESLQSVRNSELKKLASSLENILQNQGWSGSVPLAGNNVVQKAFFVAPYDLTIRTIRTAFSGSVTGDPTLTINNRDAAGDSGKNPLAAANYDLSGLSTADEPEALSLSATAANLQMNKGDALVFTVTNDADDDHDGIGFGVVYAPR